MRLSAPQIECRLKERGYSLTVIANRLGISRSTVSNVVNHYSKVFDAILEAVEDESIS